MDTSNLIKDSNIPGCSAIDKYKEENIMYLGYNKLSRVIIPIFLMMAYHHYSKARLYEEAILDNVNSYEKSESLSYFVNGLLGIKTQPSDFMESDNELANEALKSFEQFSKEVDIIKSLVLCEKEDIIDFVKDTYSEYTKELCFLKGFKGLYYPYWCDTIVAYISGLTDKESMRNELSVPSITHMNKRPANKKEIMKFIRDMINLREAFYKVIDERKKSRKKN